EVTVTDISIGFLGKITAYANATLNSSGNEIEMRNVYLSFNGMQWLAGPSRSFQFPSTRVPASVHGTSYTLTNTDSTLEFTVPSLSFRWDQSWWPAGGPDPPGAPFLTVPGPFDLLPGQSITIPLSVPPSGPGTDSSPPVSANRSFVYASGQMSYTL